MRVNFVLRSVTRSDSEEAHNPQRLARIYTNATQLQLRYTLAIGTQLHYLVSVHNLIVTGDMVKTGLTASQIRKAKRTPGILYTLVRSKLGLTQEAMAALLGVSRWAIVNRERCKRVYTVHELTALQRASGLSDAEWCELLREVAK